MNLKGNKGITLIALVVTIIVLIILAGVSINLVLGDNGILTKAKEAKEESNEAQIKEKMQMAVQEYVINKNTGSNASLEEILRENLDESKIEEITENGKTAVVTYNGERIKIDLEKGTIGEDATFDVWDGQSASEGLIGKGTEEEPYLIYSANDLNYMSQCVASEGTIVGLNEDRTKNNCDMLAKTSSYKLMTNIALNDISNYDEWNNESFDRTTLNTWMPIGRNDVADSSGKTFYGNFDGNGYEITGMYAENSEGWAIGLFGYAGTGYSGTYIATIKNVRVTNVYIIGKDNVGAIVGTLNSGANIENCYSSGYVEVKKGSDGWGASSGGGIVGYCSQESKFLNCINDAEVRGAFQIGGIVGVSKGVIENCHNTGNIYAHQDVGGISGSYTGESIKNCSNTGDIIHNIGTYSSHIGGIVGRAGVWSIEKCYNSGNIIDMVGNNYNYIGGIVGYMGCGKNVKIVDCHNTGSINGNDGTYGKIDYVGGIVGEPYNVGEGRTLTLINCTNEGIIEVTNTHVGDLVGGMREQYVIIK